MRGPVGVAVDQRAHAGCAQQRLDRGLVDVRDVLAGAGQVLAAAGARLGREAAPARRAAVAANPRRTPGSRTSARSRW